jgi:hypothetical protein
MKERRIHSISPDDMAAIRVREESRIAEFAKKNGLTIGDARKALRTMAASMSPRPRKIRGSAKPNEARPKGKLQLISKRGTRVEGWRCCSRCSNQFMATWRYAESTWGVVYLCMDCKDRVGRPGERKRRRKLDALDLAYSGGRFEGNRRRH